MAGNNSNKSGITGIVGAIIVGFGTAFGFMGNFIKNNVTLFVAILLSVVLCVVMIIVINEIIKKRRKKLLEEILEFLRLENIDSCLKPYDDLVVVKSRQTLDNYDDIKYLKENGDFEKVKNITKAKGIIYRIIRSFLADQNKFSQRSHYNYVSKQLNYYSSLADGFRTRVVYITSAGNNKGEKLIIFRESRIREIEEHPEYLMTKGEYNKLLKRQANEELEEKKHIYYDKVNSIIDFANRSIDLCVNRARTQKLEELTQQLFDRTINSIQKIKLIDSYEWEMLNKYINSINEQIQSIAQENDRILQFYNSDDFTHIKEICDSLNTSRKDFNEYIEEKSKNIMDIFGKRLVRNETQKEDTYNYIRSYKKSVTPFTANVSSSVFGSAENNPIEYLIKYFYPDKSQYKEQIQKLKVLIEELETLKEAKAIIDNYKKDYDQYIQNVPDYVLDNDSDGFYSRLGLAIIDEAILNVEYKFTYTSDGGMAQRSFTIPMNEENIIELINRLESKLSLQAQTKEQRALMTMKLRTFIKERDNYTCCQCGNSSRIEPNLLLEVDHIIPIVKGGLTKEDNLQTLCWKCNRAKGAKL